MLYLKFVLLKSQLNLLRDDFGLINLNYT